MDLPEPPMELGETLKGTDSDGNLINGDKLGQIYTFPASRITSNIRGNKQRYTGRPIKAVLLRNELGAALLGKRVAKLKESGGYGDVEAVDGYCAVKADAHVVVVDPFLPSAGCADDDIFWGILEGTVPVLSPFEAGGFDKTIAIGDPLVGATGSTTGTSGVGRVSVGGVLAGGSLAATEGYAHARNCIGRGCPLARPVRRTPTSWRVSTSRSGNRFSSVPCSGRGSRAGGERATRPPAFLKEVTRQAS
jgi:hypothetical protein